MDKGVAIRYLCNFLDISTDNTIAVGDEQNDITMIQNANIGVVVANAVEEAKRVADYITEHDNNHDAIAEVIEKFIL